MSDDETEIDDPIIECWCGVKGTYEELFDDLDCDDGCNGTGSINCYCGGEQCVCHHHGEYECPGCEDCEGGEYGDYDWFDDCQED